MSAVSRIHVTTRSGAHYRFDINGAECKVTRTSGDTPLYDWINRRVLDGVWSIDGASTREVIESAVVGGHLDLPSIHLTSTTITRVRKFVRV